MRERVKVPRTSPPGELTTVWVTRTAADTDGAAAAVGHIPTDRAGAGFASSSPCEPDQRAERCRAPPPLRQQ